MFRENKLFVGFSDRSQTLNLVDLEHRRFGNITKEREEDLPVIPASESGFDILDMRGAVLINNPTGGESEKNSIKFTTRKDDEGKPFKYPTQPKLLLMNSEGVSIVRRLED